MDQGAAPLGAMSPAPGTDYEPQRPDVANRRSGRYNALTDEDHFSLGRFVAEYVRSIGLPPTLEEIGRALGVSKVGAHSRAWTALDAGYVRAVPRGNGHWFLPTVKTLDRL